MRILCVSNDIPLPANSGGRVDVWRRLRALSQGGHRLALLCWVDAASGDSVSAEAMAQLGEICDSVKILPTTRSASALMQRLLLLWRWPSHAASRWVSAKDVALLDWAKAFQPDVVLLDGLYGGAVAMDLRRMLGCPLWYRSHNIEHRYMAAQKIRAPHWKRRLGLAANCIGLERFERSVIRRAARVFDISQDDAVFWRGEGFSHIEWVPTLVDVDFAAKLGAAPSVKPYDVLYFGNLNTPNNVEAVGWLINKVLPLVEGANLRVAIAGSRPSREVRSLIGLDPRVEIIENPVDMAEMVGRAKVLVNPMLAGSGVNLKSVEMLFSEAGLVSTSVGVAGLAEEAKRCFAVCDTPESFAAAIVDYLNGGIFPVDRKKPRDAFSPASLLKAFGTNNDASFEVAAC